jgi:hypothetical protein
VTVTVPPSGLVELYAEATMHTSDATAAAVMTVMDTATINSYGSTAIPLPACGNTANPLRGVLATKSTTNVRVYSGGDGCGRAANPAPLLIHTTPGTHTFDMFYATGSGVATAFFSNRLLAVAPRP